MKKRTNKELLFIVHIYHFIKIQTLLKIPTRTNSMTEGKAPSCMAETEAPSRMIDNLEFLVSTERVDE